MIRIKRTLLLVLLFLGGFSLLSIGLNSSFNFSAFACAPDPKPTINATAAATSFTAVTCSTMTFNWTNGDGNNRIVMMNTVNSFTDPVDTVSYSANPVYGAGQQVVFNGAGSSVTISGVAPSNTYYFKVFEYNVTTTSCTESYLVTGSPYTKTWTALGPFSYFRSSASGNWSDATKWEYSPDNINWYPSCGFIPSNTAAAVTIRHSNIAINMGASAPNITIISGGTLIFDGLAARSLAVTNYVTIDPGGTFITQSSGAFTNTLTIGGDLTNNGTFDMSRGGTTLVCNVTFNKLVGTQNITGTGATTRFNYMTVTIGASSGNILDISPGNFQAPANFLHSGLASAANDLKNGTIKFSGTFNFTGTLFQTGAHYEIVSTAGVWLNNPNVTISGQNDSYIIRGKLQVSNGIFVAGIANGNSIRYKTNSVIIVDGGTINAAGRLNGELTSDVLNYTQSSGTLNLFCTGATASSVATLDIQSATSSFTMSGGTIVFRNQNMQTNDIFINNAITNTITGGTIQFGDASSTSISSRGYWINTLMPLPSINIFSVNVGGLFPLVQLVNSITVKGSMTIGTSTKLDVSNGGTSGTSWNITMVGNTSTPGDWINNGTFDQRDKVVVFSGSTNQNISGTSSTTFHSLAVAKGSSSKILLNVNTNIGTNTFSGTTGVLTLTLGHIDLNGFKLTITNPLNTAVTGYSNNSYIISETAVGSPTLAVNPSQIQWNMSTQSTSHDFPFGTGGKLIKVTFKKNTVSANITISTRATTTSDNMPWTGATNVAAVTNMWDPTIGVGVDGSVEAVIDRWWEIYSSAVGTSPTIDFNYRGVENTLIGAYNTQPLAAQNWNGTKWLPSVCNVCNNGSTGASPLLIRVTNASIDSGAVWVLSSQIAPLPITMISFTGNCDRGKTVLSWVTESEVNNDFFTVERSEDAKEFTRVSPVIKGAGNSSSAHYYQFTDMASPSTHYYRIKQTDFDGRFTYSDFISVRCNDDGKQLVVYPNPAGNKIFISIPGNKLDEDLVIDIIDMKGALVKQSIIRELKNNSEPIDISDLSKGFYLIKAHNNSLLYTNKLVKE